jgi:hypothetical protein
MSHAVLRDASLWRRLLAIDLAVADEVRAAGCPHCGGVLHSARYPRKPRGVPRAWFGEDYDRRASFCCAQPDCRRRRTPPSLRFLGRRVYLGAVFVVLAALAQGVSSRQRARLCARYGIDRRTWRRWRQWWLALPASPLWRLLRGRWRRPPDPAALPRSLLRAFAPSTTLETLVATLRLLAPVSTGAVHIR